MKQGMAVFALLTPLVRRLIGHHPLVIGRP
ncbi:MAG: hypothetical protein YPKNTGVA_002775, partial [Candidatus Fervidibacter sp.]